MEWGLKAILLTGGVWSLILGFSLSGFVLDRLASGKKLKGWSPRTRLSKALLFVTLGTISSIITFALSIVIIWPPHIW